MNHNIRITEDVLVPEYALNTLNREDCGAIVSFIGTVRNTANDGKAVSFLEIKKSGKDAEAKLQEIASEIILKWNLRPHDIVIYRRIGKLAVGEVALVVAIAAAHRPEAFAACAHVVDRIKEGHITVEEDLP